MAVGLLERPEIGIIDQPTPIRRAALIQLQTDEPTVNGMRELEWPIAYLIQAALIRQNLDLAIRAVVQSKILTPSQRVHNMSTLLDLKHSNFPVYNYV